MSTDPLDLRVDLRSLRSSQLGQAATPDFQTFPDHGQCIAAGSGHPRHVDQGQRIIGLHLAAFFRKQPADDAAGRRHDRRQAQIGHQLACNLGTACVLAEHQKADDGRRREHGETGQHP